MICCSKTIFKDKTSLQVNENFFAHINQHNECLTVYKLVAKVRLESSAAMPNLLKVQHHAGCRMAVKNEFTAFKRLQAAGSQNA